MEVLTLQQLQNKYMGKWVDAYDKYNYTDKTTTYEIRKVFDEVHENTREVTSTGFTW